MGFAVSFLIGFGILRLLSNNGTFRTIDLFFSWGVGVGIASQIAFFSILLGGAHKGDVILSLAFISVVLIWAAHIKIHCHSFTEVMKPSPIVFLILLFPLVIAQTFIYSNLPYGDWDAWSLWNYRANALFRSAGDWMPVYHNAIQGKHPWLLPHYIVWGWSFFGKETTMVPALTAFLMSISTVGLVVYALTSSIGGFPATLAGVFLISIPYFNWHSAGQYASIFVAFYLLGSVVAIREYLSRPSLKVVVVAGSFLAFLANSKDEGVALCGLLILFFYRPFIKQARVHRQAFLALFLTLIAMFFLTEFFMRSSMGIPFVDCKYNGLDATLLFDVGRWKIYLLYLWQMIALHPLMGGIFFLLLLALLKNKKQGGSEKDVELIYRFLLMIAAFFFLFSVLYIIATTDLSWRLSVTAHRLVFIFLPTLVYLIFGILYHKNEN